MGSQVNESRGTGHAAIVMQPLLTARVDVGESLCRMLI